MIFDVTTTTPFANLGELLVWDAFMRNVVAPLDAAAAAEQAELDKDAAILAAAVEATRAAPVGLTYNPFAQLK